MSKKSALKKNFLTVILLALAGSIIYGLPYYRFYYYDSYMHIMIVICNFTICRMYRLVCWEVLMDSLECYLIF